MFYLLLSFILFFASVVIHLTWCFLQENKNLRVVSFLLISLLSNIVFFIFSKLHFEYGIFLKEGLWNAPLIFTSLAMYILLIPFYLIIYCSTVIDSPSINLLGYIKKTDGLSYNQLFEKLGKDDFVVSRLNALAEFGFVTVQGNVYKLTAYGERIGWVLWFYHKLLGWES